MKRWATIPAAFVLSLLTAAPSLAQLSVPFENYAVLHQYGSAGVVDMKHLAMGTACVGDDRSGWHANTAGQLSVKKLTVESHTSWVAFGQVPGVHRTAVGVSYPLSSNEVVKVLGTWADADGGLLGMGVPLSIKATERDFSGEYGRRISDRLSVGIGTAYLGTHSVYKIPGMGTVTEFNSHPIFPGGRVGAIYHLTSNLNVGATYDNYIERVTKTAGGGNINNNMHTCAGRVGLAYYPDETTTLLLDYEDVTITGGGTWTGKRSVLGGVEHKVGKFALQCGMFHGRLSGGLGWESGEWNVSAAASARPAEDLPGKGGGAMYGFRAARSF